MKTVRRFIIAAALAAVASTASGCVGDSCLITTDGAKLCGGDAAAWCDANEAGGTLRQDPGTREACDSVR
jgi:hypothetical protein